LKRIIQFFKAFILLRRLGPTPIIELQEEIAELRKQACHDSLTGVYNQRFLEEVGSREIGRARRYKIPLSVIMIDIDHFKKVNDRFGHVKGNEILKKVVSLLKMSCRESDIIVRYGGDEFVVLLPNTDELGAQATRERIKKILHDLPFPLIELSCGIASWSEELSLEDLIQKADEEMYRDKRRVKTRPGL
jgi:two-component system cell cycle response regulator